jgi:hypothetical protein
MTAGPKYPTLILEWKRIAKMTRYITTLKSEGSEERYADEEDRIGD